LQKNTVKERLKAGGSVYGTSLSGCLEPEISIVLAAAGVEFFFIDTEHSTTTYAQIQGLCRTARGAGLIPLVRVTQNESSLISRALDVGAMGIIVPRVHSAAEARAAMDALKFPPLGHRGYGLGTIVTDLKGNSAQEDVNSANRETMAVMMIESQEGLNAAEEIASVPEVDALFVGPYDLSLSLGILEQFDSPVFLNALEKVINAGTQAGIAVGLQSKDISLLTRAREMGARFVIYSSDYSVLLAGYKQGISQLKS
jgi:2-dehydro-3-deoxyglucarate aldolase/4-hydroxy-2-oxoheptanedioate aldolase